MSALPPRDAKGRFTKAPKPAPLLPEVIHRLFTLKVDVVPSTFHVLEIQKPPQVIDSGQV
jgi:hypothetical protein